MEPKNADRRRWPRAPVRGEIVGQIYTETAAPVLDLSEGGALLEVPCVLRPRSLYTLRLALGQGEQLLLKATVVRSYVHHFENIGAGETRLRYHAALHFLNLTERERGLLRGRLAADAAQGAALGARLNPAEAPPTAGEETADDAAQLPDPLLSAVWPDDSQHADRRESERVSLEGSVAGEVGLQLESRVLLMGQGGMTVRMPFAPEVGTTLACSLEIEGRPVQVRGIVRDANREASESDADRYVVGLEFVDVSRPARALIADYIARRLKAAEGR